MLLRAALCAAAWAWSAVALAAGPTYVGRTVDDVLHELGSLGLRLVYSSGTVPGSLRVLSEPAGTAPIEILVQVLAQHCLLADRVGEDTYAIVRPEEGVPAAASIGAQPNAGARLEDDRDRRQPLLAGRRRGGHARSKEWTQSPARSSN